MRNATLARSRRRPASPSHVPGLTGIRALAVIGVLAYHLVPHAAPGGFIGVDVFFVVSGFIVTRMLLVERERAGRIDFRAFWMRRARRILPALVAVLAVCIPLAFIVDARLLEGVRRQLLGAVTFSSNWLAIAADGDYFQAERPDLFTNLWSLAVEEQFYLLGPVLLVVAMSALRLRARSIAAGTLVLAGVSAAAMAALSLAPLGSPTRAYFGTDTHAFGLLIGVTLALALGSSTPADLPLPRATARTAIGIGSLAALVWLAATMSSSSWFPAHGGLLVASLAAAGLVWSSATAPTLGRALDSAPLRWLGERSYAVYLWHWPLLLIAGATPLGSAPGILALVVATLSVAAAAVSFLIIETPFRRPPSSARRSTAAISHAPLRRSDRSRRARRRAPTSLIAGTAAGAMAISAVLIVALHDDSSDTELLVARGRAAIGTQASGGPASTGEKTPAPESDATATPAAPTTPPATAVPVPVVGTDVTAVGDSVMLAAAPELQATLPGIAIDAEVSRSMWVAPDILSRLAADGSLRPIVVLGLATNGDVGADLLEQVLDTVGPERTLVLVTAHADRDWVPGTNATLADFAAAHTNVVVADWDGAIASLPDDLAYDGIHPEPEGSTVYAGLIPEAIANARAEVADASTADGAG